MVWWWGTQVAHERRIDRDGPDIIGADAWFAQIGLDALTARVDVPVVASMLVRLPKTVELLLRVGDEHLVVIERPAITAGIEQDGIMLAVELAFAIAAAWVEPDDFVEHPFGAEDFVHEAAQQVRLAKIAVQVDAAIVGEQVAQCDQAFVHKLEIGVVVPGIAVFSIGNRNEPRRTRTAQAYAAHTVDAGAEWRVDVDQIDALSIPVRQKPGQRGEVLAADQHIRTGCTRSFHFDSGRDGERRWQSLSVPCEQGASHRRRQADNGWCVHSRTVVRREPRYGRAISTARSAMMHTNIQAKAYINP